MFTRKHHFANPSTEKDEYHFKTKEIHSIPSNPLLKFSISLSVFLASWFLLLFFWFPPTRIDSSHQTQYDREKGYEFPSKSAPRPVCKENLSLYMYDLPPKFNLELLDHCRQLNVYTDMCPHVANRGLGQPISGILESSSGGGGGSWFATHQFIAEMIFHARVEKHPCRTWDPEQATLFYVPFYGGLHASSMFRELRHESRDALAVELSEYVCRQPWWEKKQGKDHFLALGRTAWDFMRTTQTGPDFGANCLLNLPPVQNMSVLTVERHPWQGSNQHGIPYPSYFHPSTSDEVVTWQEKMGRMGRPHLFSFVGAPRTGVEKAAVRDEIIRQCAESSRCNLLKCGHGASRCHEPKEVIKVMARSEFCLQAPGDSFTRRSTFDSVLAGCIPVFFSRHTAYSQYAWYLPADPSTYSVYIEEEEERNAKKSKSKIKRIEEELLKIPAKRVEGMRRTVLGLIPTLTYMHPNSTSDYGFRDAVDVALAALSNHVDVEESSN